MGRNERTKYIFVTGGVVSSLGKGIIASSVGALLETRGLKVTLSKADPYINIDPGTMSPTQHGEVFVTEDGAETDLDLGHYERFTHASLTRRNSFSSGQVYDAVLGNERLGRYLGRTVQVVPHITDQIKHNIFQASEGVDISIVEIGGTVGDIESLPYLESIRQLRYELGDENVLCIHLTLVPYIAAAKELKTKPTQHSVKELRSIGIQPDILVCRADREIPSALKNKIATFCNVKREHVFEAIDVESIYKIPLVLHQQGLDEAIVSGLNIWTGKPDLSRWQTIENRLNNPTGSCRIAIVGKYTEVADSYKSIEEALAHGGIANSIRVDKVYIDAALLNESNVAERLADVHGLIVPGGFGERAVEGKLAAIRYVRESGLPFLGICLGMQLAVVEFARNVLSMEGAGSSEFVDGECPHPVVHLMEEQKEVVSKGGTMRLGSYPCEISPGTIASEAYGAELVWERHRHRFEFNSSYAARFEEAGVAFAGKSPDGSLVEMIELKEHSWFVACQFHPELKSKPVKAHPLFSGLVRHAASEKKKVGELQDGQDVKGSRGRA